MHLDYVDACCYDLLPIMKKCSLTRLASHDNINTIDDFFSDDRQKRTYVCVELTGIYIVKMCVYGILSWFKGTACPAILSAAATLKSTISRSANLRTTGCAVMN